MNLTLGLGHAIKLFLSEALHLGLALYSLSWMIPELAQLGLLKI